MTESFATKHNYYYILDFGNMFQPKMVDLQVIRPTV
jgi:hypothetical protein